MLSSLGPVLCWGISVHLGQILGFGFTLTVFLFIFLSGQGTQITFLSSSHRCHISLLRPLLILLPAPMTYRVQCQHVHSNGYDGSSGSLLISARANQDLSCDRKAICKEGFGWWEVWVAQSFLWVDQLQNFSHIFINFSISSTYLKNWLIFIT